MGIGLALALSAGVIDVCVALLNKPRGFETLTALPTSILATVGVILPLYVVLVILVRPIAARIGLEPRSVASALAGFLGSVFTLALLAGLHTAALSPQTVFRSAIVLALSALTSAGVYAMDAMMRRDSALRDAARTLVVALPMLLFEVLLSEWLQVYAIDRLASLPSVLAITALVIATAATIGSVRYTRRNWSAPWVLATFALLLAVVPVLGAIGSRKPNTVQASGNGTARVPRRIILLTVDTLRADALSSYRPKAPRTSAIDRLAGDGVVFDHALAPAPWTLPSLTSILSGLLPAAHQTTGFTSGVSRNITTVAEYLSERGYQTAAFVHNDLLNPLNGLSQGFGDYHTLYEPWFADSLGMRTLQTLAPAWFPPSTWPSNDDETRLVEGWLESNRDRNFFLWVHYFDPHAPYTPPREYWTAEPLPSIGPSFEGQKTAMQGFFVPSVQEREAIRSLYDGEVRYIDANIERVLGTLKRLHLYDDSLIVFTSDHGEEFWEHGRLGHGHSLYDELLRVPLIVKLPGSKQRGRTAVAVSTASVTPTILDASGIRYDAGNVSVPSLLPLIDSAAGTYTEFPIVSGAQIMFDRREAVFFEGYKYIVSAVDGKEELFDLSADPREQNSVAALAAGRIEQAHRLLQAHSASAASLRKRLRIEEGAIQADEDTVRRLRTLGYLK
jgi:arylsulfatase A-like enzyme